MTLYTTQPLKTLYTLLFTLKLLLLILPTSLIRYIPKSTRPIPGWSLKICVVNVLARELFKYYTATRWNGVVGVEKGHRRAKERFALVEPAEDPDLYEGVLRAGAVKPAAVGGLWFPRPIVKGSGEELSSDVSHEKVVLHCPGGAFVLAFGTEENGELISKIMARDLKVDRTFLGQYRVSTDSSTRFPGAIQDLVTFYHYILSMGVRPENIVVSGDSAAGNLVLGLLRYLEDLESPRLPLPGGAMLWSPWVHVTPQAGKDYDECRNSTNDLLIGPLLQWGADAYFPAGKPTKNELAFISPLHHPFRTSVPLFIHAGGCEAFFDQIKDFAQEMDEVEGNRIRFHASDLAPHNLLLAFKGLGLDREMEVAAKDAYDFFAQDE